MLYKLLAGLGEGGFYSAVVSLTDVGKVGLKIRELGIEVQALGLKRTVPNPLGLIRLAKTIRKQRPNVIQSWMYHADLAAGLAAKLAGGHPVIWNIRNSNLDPETKKLTQVTARLCARLSSSLPTKIICCSEASKREHIALGYTAETMQVIPNGFDTAEFRPDEENKLKIRKELEVDRDVSLIGLVARYDPQKDFFNYISAAKLLQNTGRKVMFVMAGERVEWGNQELSELIRKNGIKQNVRLLGNRDDIQSITCAFDIATSSSKCNEGFSNTVGEAMSCGVPCVVTDVGDSKYIVGETGIVVPPGDSTALACAWKKLIDEGDEGRRKRGQNARQRIVANFNIASVVEQYKSVYTESVEHVRT